MQNNCISFLNFTFLLKQNEVTALPMELKRQLFKSWCCTYFCPDTSLFSCAWHTLTPNTRNKSTEYCTPGPPWRIHDPVQTPFHPRSPTVAEIEILTQTMLQIKTFLPTWRAGNKRPTNTRTQGHTSNNLQVEYYCRDMFLEIPSLLLRSKFCRVLFSGI